MSLINQMLQDIEQRRGEAVAAPGGVRAVTRRGADRSGRWIALAALLVVGLGGGFAVWQAGTREPAPPPAVAANAPQTPARPLPTPVVQAELQPVSAPPPQEIAPRADVVPAPVVAAPQAPATIKASLSPPPRQASAAKPATPVAPVAPGEPEKTAAEPDVPKEIKSVSPQQRSEYAYRQALGWLQQGRTAEALDGLQQVLQLDPAHAAARQALAGLQVEAKRFDRAEQTLQQGLELNPTQTGFAMALARLQVERGDTRAALATLQHSQPHAADKGDYHAFMAALLQRLERHKEAVEHYRAALRTAPASGPWLIGLGISMQADKQFPQAADAFTRARHGTGMTPELQAFADQRLRQLQPYLP